MRLLGQAVAPSRALRPQLLIPGHTIRTFSPRRNPVSAGRFRSHRPTENPDDRPAPYSRTLRRPRTCRTCPPHNSQRPTLPTAGPALRLPHRPAQQRAAPAPRHRRTASRKRPAAPRFTPHFGRFARPADRPARHDEPHHEGLRHAFCGMRAPKRSANPSARELGNLDFRKKVVTLHTESRRREPSHAAPQSKRRTVKKHAPIGKIATLIH